MFNLNKIVKPYSVVFVDIDNTLFNYTYAHSKALESVLSHFNMSIKDYNKAKIEIKKRDLKSNHHKKELYFKNMCETNNLHFSKTLDMYNMYTDVFAEHLLVDNSMFNMLKYAKENNKKVIAITNYYVIPQINKLNNSGFSEYIDYLITSEEFEIEKPSSKLFNKAIKLAGNPAKEEIIMFGDSVVDDLSWFNVRYYPYNCSKLLISISGKSGAGKSTLSTEIEKIFNCKIIEGDGYHKYERNHKVWNNVTHYNPEANNLLQLGLDIKHIYQDIGSVHVPVYNHCNGKFEESTELNNKDLDVVLIDGLHSLYKEVTGEFVKIKIFIDNEHADTQKVQRDITHRNKLEDEVQNSIDKREDDYIKYIQTQNEFANFVITIKDDKFDISIDDDIILNLDTLSNSLTDYKCTINRTKNKTVILGYFNNLIDIMNVILLNLKNERWKIAK